MGLTFKLNKLFHAVKEAGKKVRGCSGLARGFGFGRFQRHLAQHFLIPRFDNEIVGWYRKFCPNTGAKIYGLV